MAHQIREEKRKEERILLPENRMTTTRLPESSAWSQLIQASMDRLHAPVAASSRMKLPLLSSPRPRQLPRQARELAAVNPGLLAAFEALAGGQADWPLFLHGQAGTGKTCAALALADHVQGSEYWTAQELCEQLIEASFGRLTVK